jgi:hypothetical protein
MDQTDLMGEISNSSVLKSAYKISSCTLYEMECLKEQSPLEYEVLLAVTMVSAITSSDVMKCSLVKVSMLEQPR